MEPMARVEENVPVVPLITSNTGVSGPATDPERMFFIDIGSGDAVMILVHTDDPAAFGAFNAQALPIIQGLHFP